MDFRLIDHLSQCNQSLRWHSGKEYIPANAGDARDTSVVPGLGKSTGEGNGNPLEYSCLENPMNRRAQWTTVPYGHKESNTTEHAHTPDMQTASDSANLRVRLEYLQL